MESANSAVLKGANMTLHDLYFNQALVNDETALRIRLADHDWVNGHWYDDGVSIAIYRNKDREVKSLTWESSPYGSTLYIKLM